MHAEIGVGGAVVGLAEGFDPIIGDAVGECVPKHAPLTAFQFVGTDTAPVPEVFG